MSDELSTKDLPPLPFMSPVVQDGDSPLITQAWQQWLLQVRQKVNLLNETLRTLSSINLSNDGALPVTSGGTGATNKTNAFNNLNPLTQNESVLTVRDGVAVALPPGSPGTVLGIDQDTGHLSYGTQSGGGGAGFVIATDPGRVISGDLTIPTGAVAYGLTTIEDVSYYLPLYARDTQPGDPYWSQVAYLMHLSTDLVDTKNGTLVDTGGSPQSSSLETLFGQPSYLLGGRSVSQSIHVPVIPQAVLGSQDFTIEIWVNASSMPSSGQFAGLVGSRTISASNQVLWAEFNGSAQTLHTQAYSGSNTLLGSGIDTPLLTLNTWTHVAIVRSGSSLLVYYNGNLQGSENDLGGASLYNGSAGWRIGHSNSPPSGGNYLNAYVREFRFTVGVARYTANFTPPTQPFPNYGV